MEEMKKERRSRLWKPGTYRDQKAVIHHRSVEEPTPFIPKIRVIGEVDVRELLGRDTESDESQSSNNH